MWAPVSLMLGCGGAGDGHRPTATDRVDDTGTAVQPWDLDGDGHAGVGDCDDTDPGVYVGAPELCDGIDTDCDGVGEVDADGDGFLACAECNDGDPGVYPGAPDPLDGVDTDCDGTDGVGGSPDAVVLGDVLCGELGFSLDAADVDGDDVDEVFAGAPLYNPCAAPDVLVLKPTGVLDRLGTGAGPLAGWRVDAFATDGPRAAILHFGWAPGGVVDVYDVGDGTFGVDPLLRIEGTVVDYLGEVTAVGEPAEWLAVTAIVGPRQVALFPASSVGTLSIDEAPAWIVSDNTGPSTGQWLADVGDRDGDGLHELGVNSDFGDGVDPLGRAYVVTPGVDTSLEQGLETWWGWQAGLGTGGRLGSGDADGDGRPELTLYADEGRGRVHVLPWLGPGDHDVLIDATAQVVGELPGDLVMHSVLTDADGDGLGDLVVGAQQDEHTQPGKAMLFLGPLQGTLTRADAARVWVGSDPGSRFGYELVTGDFDGNGVPDLAVSAPNQDDGEVEDVGAVHFIFDYGL